MYNVVHDWPQSCFASNRNQSMTATMMLHCALRKLASVKREHCRGIIFADLFITTMSIFDLANPIRLELHGAVYYG